MPNPDPPEVSEAALQAFCCAMNTPVVNIDSLDVSPARAAIVLSADDYGELVLFVVVRSLSSGQLVSFRYQGDPGDFGSASGAMDAALSFAEGMGFIFDEDLLESGGRSGAKRAMRIWTSLTTDPSAEPDDGPLDVDPLPDEAVSEPRCVRGAAREDGGELLLDDSFVVEEAGAADEAASTPELQLIEPAPDEATEIMLDASLSDESDRERGAPDADAVPAAGAPAADRPAKGSGRRSAAPGAARVLTKFRGGPVATGGRGVPEAGEDFDVLPGTDAAARNPGHSASLGRMKPTTVVAARELPDRKDFLARLMSFF